MNPVEKSNVKALARALNSAQNSKNGGSETAADFIAAFLSEPDKNVRKKMLRKFSESRRDLAEFIENNENLINAEAERALIKAAVGDKKTAPNVQALKIYLTNKMPDKYSDKPVEKPETEDISEIEEELYGGKEQKNNSL